MTKTQTFWPVGCAKDDPDFFVCMNSLNDVCQRKFPKEPSNCGSTAAFESFTFDSIQDWGTKEFIAKTQITSSDDEPSLKCAITQEQVAQSSLKAASV